MPNPFFKLKTHYTYLRRLPLLWMIAFLGFFNSLQATEMLAPEVSTTIVRETLITEWIHYSGRLSAVGAVSLRPRVSGQVSKVNFQEGTLIETGDILFEIDKRPFVAQVNQSKAEVSQAKAQFSQAQKESNRGKKLLSRKVISKEDYESRASAATRAKALVAAAEANLELAELNLEFTQVTAPVSGRVGIAEVTSGNWVQAGQTLLAEVVAIDKVYADIFVDEQTFLANVNQWTVGETPVKIGLIENEDYPYQATLTFIDNQVNPGTGTIRLRATLMNPDTFLRPGFFAKASIPGKGPYPGILIQDQAVATDQASRYVMVVNQDNIAEYRPITLGPKIDGLRVVRSGLKSGEQVIVKGLMKARPGAPVAPSLVLEEEDKKQLTESKHPIH